jgi:hypothetical protein
MLDLGKFAVSQLLPALCSIPRKQWSFILGGKSVTEVQPSGLLLSWLKHFRTDYNFASDVSETCKSSLTVITMGVTPDEKLF